MQDCMLRMMLMLKCGLNRQSQGTNPRPKAKGKKVLTTKPHGRRAVSEGRSTSTRRVHSATEADVADAADADAADV